MTSHTLEHMIFGQPLVSGEAIGEATILALSPQIKEEQLVAFQQQATLIPYTINGILESQTVLLMPFLASSQSTQHDFVLARAYYQQPEQRYPIFQYIIVPRELLYGMGDILALMNVINERLPRFSATHVIVEPLTVPATPTGSLDKDVMLLKMLLDDVAQQNIQLLLGTLSAALDGPGVVIHNFPLDWWQRVRLVRGLMLLLPYRARPHLTFSTHAQMSNHARPRIRFCDSANAKGVNHIDWAQPQIDQRLLDTPYIAHLLELWDDNMITIAEATRSIEVIAAQQAKLEDSILDGLNTIARRHQQDLSVMQQDTIISTQELMRVLTSDNPPEGETYFRYVEHLLKRVLEERNTEGAEVVAHELDKNPALDERLQAVFSEVLGTQPDAVYVFVRARLNKGGVAQRWLKRLHDAAEQSLQVAIESGDPKIIGSWLTLIAREPSRYGLLDILRKGILKARSLAQDDPALAEALLTLAVKRQPDLLPTLLNAQLTLSQQGHGALHQFDAQAIENLAGESRELFLLAVNQALENGKACLSSATVRSLWDIHTQQQTTTLAPQYRPITLMQRMAEDNHCLQEGATATLLSLLLKEDDDELFHEVVPLLAKQDALAEPLLAALMQSGRSTEVILAVVTQLANQELLQPQQVATIYATILSENHWEESTLPIAEQLARVLSQFQDTQVSTGVLWKMAELSDMLKNEQMLRIANRRLLAEVGTMIAEEQIVEALHRLRKASQWSGAGRGMMMKWWRSFARNQSIAQLQKLDRALEGKRPLEDLRSVVQTALALRRVVGTRSLVDFAEEISITYKILQALAEGFDPEGRASILVDRATIRSELDARAEELPADARHVLATNLKELAQLVTSMADNRSKPSIIRSDDTVERQLVKGKQPPQSAIDVMRWMSGYLDGMQRDDEKEDS